MCRKFGLGKEVMAMRERETFPLARISKHKTSKLLRVYEIHPENNGVRSANFYPLIEIHTEYVGRLVATGKVVFVSIFKVRTEAL